MESQPLPVAPDPPSELVRAGVPIAKKDQEDLNIEIYEAVFLKCMGAAARIITHRHGAETTEGGKNRQIKIASAIFNRFYDDQNAMKQSKQQAEAMIHGLSQMLEGRR